MTWLSAIVAIIFNTFVNPIALESIGWKYYIVFLIVLLLFWSTAFLYYPETRGHTLEQIAVLFDKPGNTTVVLQGTTEDQEAGESEKGRSLVTLCQECVQPGSWRSNC
jgi:hypothetical protein